MKNTLVVNLCAGPGAGKTTCAWEIASELKKKNIETEYVSEYAKELVWDERFVFLDDSLKNQQFIHEQQCNRINRLLGKVDVIVTDCPTLLVNMYLKEPNKSLERDFKSQTLKEFNSRQNFNLFINRGKEFQQAGCIHDLEQSKVIDSQIKTFLQAHNIYFGTYYHKTIDVLINNIVTNLENINSRDKNVHVSDMSKDSLQKHKPPMKEQIAKARQQAQQINAQQKQISVPNRGKSR